MASWAEVETAATEKRHELVLSGASVSARSRDGGVDPNIFRLSALNFLEFSKTDLTEFPAELGRLTGLTNLTLSGNQLTSIPGTVGRLEKLKFMDISNNKISSLPAEIDNLTALQSLLAFSNCLTKLPNMEHMKNLHILNVSNNQLEEFPEGVATKDMALLLDIDLHGNRLTSLPAGLSELQALKRLDVGGNLLTSLPPELCHCLKLRELVAGGNTLRDRKLDRMLTQCHTKSVLEYLRKEAAKSGGAPSGGKAKSRKERKQKKSESEVADLCDNVMEVLHIPDDGVVVKLTEDAMSVRPYIVCCIVRNVNFNKTSTMFKRFISLQLVPLFKKKETTAERLVGQLRQEAEEIRKEKKRNTLSGVHKYLDLLKGKNLYACLLDSEDTVISLPPITNCDVTKVSHETTDILVEVTSSLSLDKCKKVADELLQCVLELGLGETGSGEAGAAAAENASDPDSDEEVKVKPSEAMTLVVEQVKVTDMEGNLRVVYPSRSDLQGSGFRVVRRY